jgi:hypothetical protein
LTCCWVLVKCGGRGGGRDIDGEEDGVCCRRQRRRRLFGRPDHEACVAGEEAFVIVEGHYNIRAEMWYAWEVMSSRKAVMWRPWK